MTYTHPYTHPSHRVPLHAAFRPTRFQGFHAQQTYTHPYTHLHATGTYTLRGVSTETPECVPGAGKGTR